MSSNNNGCNSRPQQNSSGFQLGRRRRLGVTIVCLLAVFQSAMRFAIPAMIITGGGPTFERPQSQEISDFILAMFLLIGAIGLLTSYGLWRGETWGYFGIIILSLATMVFDLWAVFSIQSSAAMGLVLPTIFIIYLWTIRKDFSKGDRQ